MQVCALTSELVACFVNRRSEGFWNHAPASLGGGQYRILNNTAGCIGPWLALFREQPPQLHWPAVPEHWVTDDGYVRLCVAKGTLVPAKTLRCGQPQASSKRRISEVTSEVEQSDLLTSTSARLGPSLCFSSSTEECTALVPHQAQRYAGTPPAAAKSRSLLIQQVRPRRRLPALLQPPRDLTPILPPHHSCITPAPHHPAPLPHHPYPSGPRIASPFGQADLSLHACAQGLQELTQKEVDRCTIDRETTQSIERCEATCETRPNPKNRYTFQDYATSTFSCLGFDEREEYAFFERRADGRRERVPVTEKTAANLAGYLSSYMGKKHRKKAIVVPMLHFLLPKVRRCVGEEGGV